MSKQAAGGGGDGDGGIAAVNPAAIPPPNTTTGFLFEAITCVHRTFSFNLRGCMLRVCVYIVYSVWLAVCPAGNWSGERAGLPLPSFLRTPPLFSDILHAFSRSLAGLSALARFPRARARQAWGTYSVESDRPN